MPLGLHFPLEDVRALRAAESHCPEYALTTARFSRA
jgi:hypothetical protein